MSSFSRDCTIVNDKGLHARAATVFVKMAAGFQANVTVNRGATTANGKQIMMLLILAAPKGSTITIQTEGTDAGAAMAALGELVDSGFGE